jgi:transposase-like protein
VLATTDGAPGLIRAVEEVWTESLRQRCLAHNTRNVLDKVPLADQPEVKAAIRSAYYAPNREVAEMVAADVLSRYGERFPSAMRSFRDDLEACWAYLRCPVVHHKRIRTTNLLERAFVEQRRRTKIIPGFLTEKSCLKLAFATLWQTSQRWQRVRMTEFERQQLRQLRRELNLSPPSANDHGVRRVA